MRKTHKANQSKIKQTKSPLQSRLYVSTNVLYDLEHMLQLPQFGSQHSYINSLALVLKSGLSQTF